MPPKQPEFNRKRQQNPERPRTLADIGLGDVELPAVLSTNKAERKEQKRLKKKTIAEQTKSAAAFLAENKSTLLEHREQIQERAKQDSMEHALRKRERRSEHQAAQAAREAAQKAEDRRTIAFQAQQAKKQTETVLSEKRRAAIEQQIRDQETAERAKLAPMAVSVEVHRRPDIIAVRDALPVRREEQAIVEAVLDPNNDCVLIASECGGGKTTQIPQFLWEAGFGQPEGVDAGRGGMIAVTEPRRVAAIAMAKRVAEELNEPFGRTVCYSVRYSNNFHPACRLKFMTEGVLLREIQEDFVLSKYSVVVIDEAHERSVSCDVLLGMLSRLVQMRRDMALRGETTTITTTNNKQQQTTTVVPVTPLRLVVMSATLRISDFRDNRVLFRRPPPLIDVPVRRFPVHIHFARKTELHKYVEAALKKIKQIHKKLPPGGILVFMATQREIDTLTQQLGDHYEQTRVHLDHFKVRAKQRQERSELEQKDKAAEAASSSSSSAGGNNNNNKDSAAGGEAAGAAASAVDEFGYASEDYVLDAPSKKRKQVKGKSYGRRRLRSGKDREDDDDDGHDDDIDDGFQRAKAAREVDENMLEDEFGEAAAGVEGGDDDDSDDQDQDEDEDAEKEEDEDDERGEFNSMHIVPLYAMLSQQQQQRVFEDPPPGKRLCVVATNIAETSITIPNIRYVVDAGRVRNRRLDRASGVDRYQIEMVSQASAEQRAGRAGRTSVGHCYRLYTPAVFANSMAQHSDPEILRVPLDAVIMMMKEMRIRLPVRNFPFPAPPPRSAIDAALLHLQRIGALDANFQCTQTIGSRIGHYPLAPRLSRILLALEGADARSTEAVARPLLPPALLAPAAASRLPQLIATLREAIVCIVAVCTAGLDPFRSTEAIPKQFRHDGNDFVTVLCAASWFAANSPTPGMCHEIGLMHKIMTEALQLRRQIEQLFSGRTGAAAAAASGRRDEGNVLDDLDGTETTQQQQPVSSSLKSKNSNSNNAINFKLPFDTQLDECIRRVMLCGFVDQVGRRATPEECRRSGIKYVATQKCGRTPYWDVYRKNVFFVHGRSTASSVFPAPDWVVYTVASSSDREVNTSGIPSSAAVSAAAVPGQPQPKIFVRGVTGVTKEWLDAAGFRDPEVNFDDDDDDDNLARA